MFIFSILHAESSSMKNWEFGVVRPPDKARLWGRSMQSDKSIVNTTSISWFPVCSLNTNVCVLSNWRMIQLISP